MTESEIRQQMLDVGRRMQAAGLVTGSDGNLSARLGRDRFLVTPSGVPKGALGPMDLVTVDGRGGRQGGRRKPTSELALHLAVYQARPEVAAIVHAHPAHAVALSLAGVSLAEPVLPEAWIALGPVPTAPYATPASSEGPAAVAGVLGQAVAVILARHGSLTLGASLDEAYARLESLEHAARILLLACQIGRPAPVGDEERRRLDEAGRRYRTQG